MAAEKLRGKKRRKKGKKIEKKKMKKKSRNEKKNPTSALGQKFLLFLFDCRKCFVLVEEKKSKEKKTGPKKDVNALEIKPKYLFVYNNNYGKQMRTLLFGSKTSPQI